MYNYFIVTKNSQGVPLVYVIRKTPAPSGIVIYREQEIIQNDPLRGNMFYRDTKKVLENFKELTLDTDADTWIKGKHCVRESMLALQNY